jgi:hypothetical protein
MAKATSKSTGGKFPMGGKGKMFGQQHAGPKAPGVTGKVDRGNGGKFPMGGKGKMFGKGSASPAKPGVTAKGSN